MRFTTLMSIVGLMLLSTSVQAASILSTERTFDYMIEWECSAGATCVISPNEEIDNTLMGPVTLHGSTLLENTGGPDFDLSVDWDSFTDVSVNEIRLDVNLDHVYEGFDEGAQPGAYSSSSLTVDLDIPENSPNRTYEWEYSSPNSGFTTQVLITDESNNIISNQVSDGSQVVLSEGHTYTVEFYVDTHHRYSGIGVDGDFEALNLALIHQ